MPCNECGVSESSTARVLGTIAVSAAIVLLIWLFSDVLLVVFLAALLAAILRALSHWIARKIHIPDRLALAIVGLLLTATFGGLLYLIGPKLITQAEVLWKSVYQEVAQLRATHDEIPWVHWIFQHLSASTTLEGRIATSARSIMAFTASGLAGLIVTAMTALYFAVDPLLYVEGLVLLFPLARRARARQIVLDMGRTLVLWSIGQLIDMFLVGSLTAIGLTVLGIPLAFALAVLAGILTFVPFFGAILAAIPALLLGLSIGWRTALWVLVVFLCCHVVEAYIVGPFVQRRTVRLPPALTVLSMTVLGSLFGPLGVVLGAPLAAVLILLVREAYVADVLGDPQSADLSGRPRASSPARSLFPIGRARTPPP
jgi:predicted PurR-regulated permease PerM